MGVFGNTEDHLGGKPFPIGEQIDDVQVTSVEMQDNDNGIALKFNLKKDNAMLIDFRNVPTKDMPAWDGKTQEETWIRAATNLNNTIEHYCRALQIWDQFTATRIDTDDPKEYAKLVSEHINKLLPAAKLIRIKTFPRTVEGDDGKERKYARVSTYPPFAEPMSKVPSELEYTQWELDNMQTTTKTGAELEDTEVDLDMDYDV